MQYLMRGLAAVVAVGASTAFVEADELVFAFDAEVTEVLGDFSLLPAGVGVGSIIEAEYFVDRNDLANGHVYESRYGAANFHLADITFMSAPVYYQRIDIIGDDSLPVPNNTLRFRGVAYQTSPPIDAEYLVARTELRMIGRDGSLTQIDQLLDEETWEGLDAYRVLEFGFRETGAGSGAAPAATLLAAVRRVTVIPEPSAIALIATLLCCNLSRSARRRAQRKTRYK